MVATLSWLKDEPWMNLNLSQREPLWVYLSPSAEKEMGLNYNLGCLSSIAQKMRLKFFSKYSTLIDHYFVDFVTCFTLFSIATTLILHHKSSWSSGDLFLVHLFLPWRVRSMSFTPRIHKTFTWISNIARSTFIFLIWIYWTCAHVVLILFPNP